MFVEVHEQEKNQLVVLNTEQIVRVRIRTKTNEQHQEEFISADVAMTNNVVFQLDETNWDILRNAIIQQ